MRRTTLGEHIWGIVESEEDLQELPALEKRKTPRMETFRRGQYRVHLPFLYYW